MSNLKAATIVAGNSIFTEFKGALTEQYVLQQLILRYEPYYYAKTNSTQEIDFLLQDEEDEIVPLEVKAETNVKAKSLRQFVADNQSKKAYRISMNDYLQEDWDEVRVVQTLHLVTQHLLGMSDGEFLAHYGYAVAQLEFQVWGCDEVYTISVHAGNVGAKVASNLQLLCMGGSDPIKQVA